MSKSYEKTVKKFLILLLLLIVSPLILSLAFKAQRIYTTYPETIIFYILLALGILLILYTVYFGFKTFQSFLNILFNK
ncbi:DUF6095 family protein [Tenacibaculum amylolyticum]|uniref:DUF6095 family protein n=1 Tax=Tenacibaculum amylolyticum TaxID=104269 RepID=UPI0038936289